jgi:outer membrane lipoprotein-sorting protein
MHHRSGVVKHIAIASIFTAFFAVYAEAYKFDFTTVSDIVKSIKKEFGKLDTYQANFKITSEKGGKTTFQSGTIKYKSENKLRVDFDQPAGQKIVSNGKLMWIYLPSMNIVAEQDLKSNSGGLFSTGTQNGLKRLFSKYHYRFASKDQPEKQPDGSNRYTLILRQKESRSGFRKMKLWVDEKYFISRAVGETSTGKKVDIIFSNIKLNIEMPNGIFKFNAPQKARIIKNPMISEE